MSLPTCKGRSMVQVPAQNNDVTLNCGPIVASAAELRAIAFMRELRDWAHTGSWPHENYLKWEKKHADC